MALIEGRLSAKAVIGGPVESEFAQILGEGACPSSNGSAYHSLVIVRYRPEVTDFDTEMRRRGWWADDDVRPLVASQADHGGERHQKVAHLINETSVQRRLLRFGFTLV